MLPFFIFVKKMIFFNSLDFNIQNVICGHCLCEFFKGRTKSQKQITAIVEQTRIIIANSLKISPSQLFFTPNITISSNIAINYIDRSIKSILTSEFEPKSILKPLEIKARELNIPIYNVEFKEDSSIDLQSVKDLIRKNSPAFVALSQVNRKTGRFLPIKRISELCQKSNSLFLCDVSLTFGKIPINFEDCPIDFVTASSAALGALQGTSFIGIFNNIVPKPLYFGDNGEFGIVPGNENFLAICHWAHYLDYLKKYIVDINAKYLNLKKYLFECLKKNNIEFRSVNETTEHFLPNFVNLYIPKIEDLQVLLINLDIEDILVGDGSMSNENRNLLITFSEQNNKDEIEYFCKKISCLLDK